MTTLTVTGRGQVTFRKDVLKHLGIEPGGRVRLDLLPDGRAELRAETRTGRWSDLAGILASEGDPKLTIEEMNEAIAEAGAAAALGED